MMKNKLGIGIMGGAGGLNVPQHIDLIKQVGWDAFFTGWDTNHIGEWAETGAKKSVVHSGIV